MSTRLFRLPLQPVMTGLESKPYPVPPAARHRQHGHRSSTYVHVRYFGLPHPPKKAGERHAQELPEEHVVGLDAGMCRLRRHMPMPYAGQQGGTGGCRTAPAELAVDVARPRGVRAQLRQTRVVALLHACAPAALSRSAARLAAHSLLGFFYNPSDSGSE